MTSPITHVSDTARWVAMYRAIETERPDALFHDRHARRLAGPAGEQILRAMPKARQYAWPMIVRTAVMDEIIVRLVERDRVDTVINLAAGLDARPYRLPLPAALRWVEVDFPDVLDYKDQRLRGERPVCALERVAADLADPAGRAPVLDRAAAGSRVALVVTEGLLVYLEREQVSGLARDLAARAAVRFWLTDLALPRLLEMMAKTWGPALQRGNAPMKFAPAEGTAFFEPLGWRETEFRSNWEESFRLNRTMRFGRLWRFMGRLMPRRKQEEFRRLAGIVVLERVGG